MQKFIRLFNTRGTKPHKSGLYGQDRRDPRAGPTEVLLVNRNYQYKPADANRDPSKPVWAHPGITPTQEDADGRVRINLDALAEWQAVKPGYIGESIDPFNAVTGLYHEMVEHSEGARIGYDHFEDRGPRDRTTGFPGPGPHERGDPVLTGSARERRANDEAVKILRDFAFTVDAPVRPSREYVEERRKDGVELEEWIVDEAVTGDEYPRDLHENPVTLVSTFQYGKQFYIFTVEMDAQGLPLPAKAE